ncbi:hypothetical protein ACSXAY_02625 [Clostridium perfringens]
MNNIVNIDNFRKSENFKNFKNNEYNDFIGIKSNRISVIIDTENFNASEYSDKNKNIHSNNGLKSQKIVGDNMDENQFLNKYLDKVDQDRRDQEERLNNAIIESEKRIHEERVEFEKRILKDRKESEERLEKKFDQLINYIEKNSTKLEDKITNLEQEFKNTSEKLEGKIDNNNKWIIGVCLTTILSIAALVVSILVSNNTI